ncbi:MAG TPA: ABC transporter [Thermodesulforhabdus norvegica]|uniref:Transport permease protein n=1 Tax=Thermodesulforhabdus norvegica TaxID=39841 RepID=A0A7C0WUT1_9BACT|nr:ABC transporter permease [Deltaproteobacteria bacterium]MBW2069070.1 ABC transporter permease [Deltaproteobacteria bacterium]HDL89706.1 ABC transporter [Thermodesulforhabdus norvegica]
MRGWSAVFYREILILKTKIFRQLASMSVMPLLYIVAFGYGLGNEMTVNGVPYLAFLIPGLAAMSSMIQGFNIASEINITRFYWRVFEEFQVAPIRSIAYVTGEVLFGVTRAAMGVGIITGLAWLFGIRLSYNFFFWLAMVMNAFLFASLAVSLAMLVRSHADQALLVNFVITPMGFLGGTFFPVEKMPHWVQILLEYLPITHAAKAMRAAALGNQPDPESYVVLGIMGVMFFVLAVICVSQAKD